jgi:hypothetical protein
MLLRHQLLLQLLLIHHRLLTMLLRHQLLLQLLLNYPYSSSFSLLMHHQCLLLPL